MRATSSARRGCACATARRTCCVTCRSGCAAVRLSRCSGRTGPGRPPRSRSWKASGGPRQGRSACLMPTRSPPAAGGGPGLASCCSPGGTTAGGRSGSSWTTRPPTTVPMLAGRDLVPRLPVTCSPWSAWPARPAHLSGACPAASGGAWTWPSRWRGARSCCSSTSRRRAWTRRRAGSSTTCSPASGASWAPRS